MSRKCLVPECQGKGTLFSPRNEQQKVLWRDTISYVGKINAISNFRVCEHHFTDGQFADPEHLFLRLAPRRRKCFLKQEAVPDTNIQTRVDINLNVSTILI